MPVPPRPRAAGRPRRPGLLGAGLVLLALWVQALAPAAALRMALAAESTVSSAAALDPLAGAVICGPAPAAARGWAGPAGAAADPSGPDPPGPRACDQCGLCRAGLAPPPAPAQPPVGHALRWIAAAWPVPPPVRPAAPFRPAGQPRAPPVPA